MGEENCNFTQTLAIWRSPIDKVALSEAASLSRRQPKCTIVYDEDFSQISMFNYALYIEESSDADAALDAMFTAMGAAHTYYGNIGGLAYIPQLQAPVDAPDPTLRVHQVPDQINMLGSGLGGSGATSFYHFKVKPTATAPNISQFITDTGSHTSGGKFLRSLSIEWRQSGAQAGDTCILAEGWNTRAIDCNFVDCPTVLYASGVACGLEQCTIQYTKGAPAKAVAVNLAGSECFVIGPGAYRQDSIHKSGPAGCTGIALGGNGTSPLACEHAVVKNVHLSDWSYAINYSFGYGAKCSHISNVEAQADVTCVNMGPIFEVSSPDYKIYGEKYTSCLFAKSGDSLVASPIVFIDTNGQTNDAINDIEFRNCSVISTSSATTLTDLYCYQITSGSNIRIIGGTASNAGPATGSAGIAIIPTTISGGPVGPGRITILGVDLNPTYPQAGGGGAQTYALYISAVLQDVVTVDDCRMYGYGTSGPVRVTGTVTNYLFIRNCQGYNDQSTPIASGGSVTPYPSITIGNTAATAGALPGGVNYYGPTLMIFTVGASALSVYINGVTSTYPANSIGTVFLNSPYDEFYFAAAPFHFHWLGK